MRVVVIGAGASGAATVLQLLRAAPAAHVTVVDARGCAWRGPAYATPAECHLLNIPRAAMSILPDAPGDFEAFLREEVAAGRADGAWLAPDRTHSPRGLYGRYLATRVAQAVAAAPAGRVRLLAGLAVAVDAAANVVTVNPPAAATADTLPGGAADPHQPRFAVETVTEPTRLRADFIVLANGNLPPRPLRPLAEVLMSPRYVGDPWAFPPLPPGATVGLVGSRLTAVDFALLLRARGHTGPLVFFSRTGQLPRENRGHDGTPPHPDPAFIAGAADMLSLDEVAEALRRECRRAAAATSSPALPWHSVVDALRPHTNALWRRLGDGDRTATMSPTTWRATPAAKSARTSRSCP